MKWINIILFVFSINSVSAQLAPAALIFDGTTNVITFPSLAFLSNLGTNSFAVEAWVRLDDSTSAQRTVFSTADETGGTSQGFRISINNSYLTVWGYGPGGFGGGYGISVGTNYFSDGMCHHIAISRSASSSTMEIYVDGIFKNVITNPGDISSQIFPTIGATNASGWAAQRFKGVIKEVRVWSSSRTQSQIQTNANVAVPFNSPDLKYYWRILEGPGSNYFNNYANTTPSGGGFLTGTANWSTACYGCTLPVATLTYNTPLTFCYGSNVVLNAPTGLGYTYVWKINNVPTIYVTGPTMTVTTAGNYSVEITNLCGTSISNTVTTTVINLPSKQISPSTTPVTKCISTVLYANAGPGFIYQWKKNGINIAGATNYNYTVTSTGTYSFTVSNACTTLTSSSSIAVTIITAVPATPGTITVSNGIAKVCPGETRTYTIPAITNATSYTWTAPAGSVIQSGQGTTSVNILYNSGFTINDTLRVKANNICGSGATRKLTITRNNPAKPSVVTGQNYGLCNSSSVPYSVTNVTGITYNWTFSSAGAVINSGQGTNVVTANYSSPFLSGILNVSASNGCGVSPVRTYSVYAKPATPASINGLSSVCVNQQNVAYSINPLPGAINYTWTSPTGSTVSDGVLTANTITTTATSVLVDFGSTSGNVRARGNNSCAIGSYKSLPVTFGCRIDESANEHEILIYPNPFSDYFSFEQSGYNEILIHDQFGRLVYKNNLTEGENKIRPAIASGVYQVSMIGSKLSKTFTVVKTQE